jgi:hypothetical protein
MFPWLFLWAPQYHWPLSGVLSQDVAPDTSWFFGSIPPWAGDSRLEKEIFESNSYGKQIGVLSDVLMALVEPEDIDATRAEKAIEQFKEIYREIKEIKARNKTHKTAAAIQLLEQIEASDPQELERILARFQHRLDELHS